MTFNMSDLGLIAPHMVIAATALVVLLLEAFGPGQRKGYLAPLSLAGIVIAAFVTPGLFGPQRLGFSGMYAADGFAAFFYVILYVVGGLTVMISENYLNSERVARGEYYALMLLALLGMMFMAGATHLLVVFLALETMSIAVYALAGYLRTERSVESSFKYFILGAFSSGFLLYGIALVYGACGTTQIYEVMKYFTEVRGLTASPMAMIGVGLIIIGFGFKVAAVPFHAWTPDVYQGAPTSVTAFMATGVKAAAFSVFLRVFFTAFQSVSVEWGGVLWVLALLTMTLGNFAAIAQTDVKRMLAYSSIAHAGYLLVGMVAGTAEAGSGMLFYLLGYAFMNVGAFACVIMLGRYGQENTELDAYAGLGFRFPLLGFAMSLFMLSMAGIPPTIGFIGKFLIFKAAIHEGYYWLTILGVLNSAASVYYYLRVIVTMYFKPAPEQPAVEALRCGPGTAVATALAGACVLCFGIVPGAIVRLAEEAVKYMS
jgi:NADH-quinone oxidoreductase subunit N